jgi:hypothetical protein
MYFKSWAMSSCDLNSAADALAMFRKWKNSLSEWRSWPSAILEVMEMADHSSGHLKSDGQVLVAGLKSFIFVAYAHQERNYCDR